MSKYSYESMALYKQWRAYHARHQWVMVELIQDVMKESRKSKKPISITKVIERMKDKPRIRKRVKGKIVLQHNTEAIRRVRLQMNRNHYPFYAAFFKVIKNKEYPEVVARVQTYKSRHNPEGQIRDWLEAEGVGEPRQPVIQGDLGIDLGPSPTEEQEGHY